MSNAKAITIPNAGTTSAAFEIGINAVRALELPAAMTNTSVKFQGSLTQAGTYKDIYHNGVLVSVRATASTWQGVSPSMLVGYPWLKLVATGVGNEAADRVINVLYEDVI